MKLPIDLTKNHDMEPPCCMKDSVPGGPTVHFHWDEEYDFPDEGEMTVKFKVIRREEEVQREKYTEVVELIEITKVKASKVPAPARSLDESSDALDKLRAESEED
jgi:hypothetical protein